MSLTRREWTDMWLSIKLIESLADELKSKVSKRIILEEVTKIKNQIQQVIGQME